MCAGVHAVSDNPFKLHEVKSINEAGDFAAWLAFVAEQGPVAIAFKSRAKKIAVSTIDDCYVIDLKTIPMAGLVLANALMLGRLNFVLRNSADDLAEMAEWVSGMTSQTVDFVFRQFEESLVGDLYSAAYCINQIVTPHNKFQRVDQDAYEIVLTLGHYTHSIIPYYEKVGLPYAKLRAEAKAREAKSVEWFVTYPDLWVRVLAFFTGDPTLAWSLNQTDDVYDTIGRVFGQDRDFGKLVLTWAASGMEITTFRKRFKSDALPDDLEAFNTEISRRMPNLVLGVNATKTEYLNRRRTQTRYGRELRPGQDAGEAVAHAIFGTADDITAIAAVALWTNRTDRSIMITGIGAESGSPESIRISGCGPELVRRPQWLQEIRELADLENPLLEIALAPLIVVP